MPSQELSAEQLSYLEFGQEFSRKGGCLEMKIGQPCKHLVLVCRNALFTSCCSMYAQFPLLIQVLANSGATSSRTSPMHQTVTWIIASKNFQNTLVTLFADLLGSDF